MPFEKATSMSILLFSPTPSHPQDAGNRVRIFNLAYHLQSLGYSIHFVYFTQEGLSEEQRVEMLDQWDSLTIIKREKTPKRPETEYYMIDDWYQEDIGPIVQRKCRESGVDVIITNYIFQSRLLEFVPEGVVRIIDTHDRFSDRHLILKKNGLKPDFFYTVAEEEAKALNRADMIFAIQDDEKKFFESISKTKVRLLGHIEQEDFIRERYEKVEKIGFIGSGNSTNQRSLEDFISHFLTFNKSREKSLRLVVAGSICDKVTVIDEAIDYKGHVDDLRSFYDEVDLIINPLILGTGLKIKSIEALSYGVPMISTDIGFEGIDSDSDFHRAKDNKDLLDLLDKLIDRSRSLDRLAESSRTIFRDYSRSIDDKIDDVISEMGLLVQAHKKEGEKDLLHLVQDLSLQIGEKKDDIDFTEKIRPIQTGYGSDDVVRKSLKREDLNKDALQAPKKKTRDEDWSKLLLNIGDCFVEEAYLHIVKRPPSNEEMRDVRQKMRDAKMSKVEILYQISSQHGNKKSQSELQLWYGLYKVQGVRFFGGILRQLYAVFRLPRFLHRILKTISAIQRVIEEQSERQIEVDAEMMLQLHGLNSKVKRMETDIEENRKRVQRNEHLSHQLDHTLKGKSSLENMAMLEDRMEIREKELKQIESIFDERAHLLQKVMESKISLEDLDTVNKALDESVMAKEEAKEEIESLKQQNAGLKEHINRLHVEIYGNPNQTDQDQD